MKQINVTPKQYRDIVDLCVKRNWRRWNLNQLEEAFFNKHLSLFMEAEQELEKAKTKN